METSIETPEIIEPENNEETQITSPAVYLNVAQEVKSRIASAGNQVKEKVVEALAKDEIERRIRVGEVAIRLEQSMSKEFNKIKPDQVKYITPGDEKTAIRTWSPEQGKKYTECERKLTAFRTLINKAFDVESFTKEAWDKLEEAVNKATAKDTASQEKK